MQFGPHSRWWRRNSSRRCRFDNTLTTDPVGQSRRDRTVVQDGIPAIPTQGKSPVGIVGELTIIINTDPGVRRQSPITVGGCRAGALRILWNRAAIRCSCCCSGWATIFLLDLSVSRNSSSRSRNKAAETRSSSKSCGSINSAFVPTTNDTSIVHLPSSFHRRRKNNKFLCS